MLAFGGLILDVSCIILHGINLFTVILMNLSQDKITKYFTRRTTAYFGVKTVRGHE